MRVILLTDIHANLPALQTVLEVVEREGYDLLYHAGDAISIGPFPREVIELLASLKSARFVQGNHDALYVHGIPAPRPSRLSEGEVEHQQWTHRQLGDQWHSWVSDWPYQLDEMCDGLAISILHYGIRGPKGDFKSFVPHPPSNEALDELFAGVPGSMVCYGHNHEHADNRGKRHYVNPGSLGCYNKAEARFAILDITDGHYTLEYRSIPYNDASLLEAFESREVPERHFIYKAFYGNRW